MLLLGRCMYKEDTVPALVQLGPGLGNRCNSQNCTDLYRRRERSTKLGDVFEFIASERPL